MSLPLPLSQRGIPPNTEPLASPYIIDAGEGDVSSSQPDVSSSQSYVSSSQPDVSASQPDVSASQPDVSSSQSYVSSSQPDAHSLGVCPFSKGATATYCGRTNKHVKNKYIQSRLDRIYVKIKRNSLKVHFYGLTGTFTQPSDHFGVFAQLEF
jgi:hypothetical protein